MVNGGWFVLANDVGYRVVNAGYVMGRVGLLRRWLVLGDTNIGSLLFKGLKFGAASGYLTRC